MHAMTESAKYVYAFEEGDGHDKMLPTFVK